MCELFGRVVLWLFGSVSFSNWIEILKLLTPARPSGSASISTRNLKHGSVWNSSLPPVSKPPHSHG